MLWTDIDEVMGSHELKRISGFGIPRDVCGVHVIGQRVELVPGRADVGHAPVPALPLSFLQVPDLVFDVVHYVVVVVQAPAMHFEFLLLFFG